MAILQPYSLTKSPASSRAGSLRPQGFDLEAFFSREAARGMVAGRLMLLGAGATVLFAALGYVVFGAGNQHQFFRDIGPVTALAALQTFAVGYVGLLIARREQPRGGAGLWLNFWFLAGAGFILLTFDAPLDLHGRVGHFIDARTTVAQDIGFHGSGDAILALYMLTGLTVATLYWREMLRYPRVMAHLIVGGVFIAASIGIDGFAAHTSWMWVLEEGLELLGLAWIVGAFAVRLEATQLHDGGSAQAVAGAFPRYVVDELPARGASETRRRPRSA